MTYASSHICETTRQPSESGSDFDRAMMRRALQLAANGAGHVSPNPMVGAVITAPDGRIIGEGWHRKYGGPHAEVQAFRNVRPEDEPLLTQSTIYVTLEPCSHYGKTPPCARLLVEKKIARAVIGCGDPNPKVAGRGIAILREAGIEVTENVLVEECRFLNRRFMTAHTLCRPWILLKWAESADGFIDCPVSTPLSKLLMHRERSMCDAILVGTDTILNDNPSLTTRFWPGNSPRPVAFRSPHLPMDLTLGGREIIWLDRENPLEENMRILFSQYGITSLMVEGGAKMLAMFIAHGLYDEIRQEIGNKSGGGKLRAPELPD